VTPGRGISCDARAEGDLATRPPTVPAASPSRVRVGDTGDPFAAWLSDWILEANRTDNLGKLERSEAQERHLFVLLPGFNTAPFIASELLMRSTEPPVPTVPPTLPPEVRTCGP